MLTITLIAPGQPQIPSQSSQQHYAGESSAPLHPAEVRSDKGKGKAKHKKLPLYQDRPAMCEMLGIEPKDKLAMNDYLRFVQRACVERGLHLEDRWLSYDEDRIIRPMGNTVRILLKNHFGIEFPRNLVRALMHRCCINNKRASTKRLQRRGLKGKRGCTGKGKGKASHCSDASDAEPTKCYADDSSEGGDHSSDSDNSEGPVSATKRRSASVEVPHPPAQLGLDPGVCSTNTIKDQHAKQAVEQEHSIKLYVERPGDPIRKQVNVSFHAAWSKIERCIRLHTVAEFDAILQYRAHGCDDKDPWFPVATTEDWARVVNTFGIGGQVDIRKAPETEWLSPGNTDDEVWIPAAFWYMSTMLT